MSAVAVVLVLVLVLALVLNPARAFADEDANDPCRDSISDAVATPLRETDVQRAACLRDELSVTLATNALIDTPSFHGVIGGELALAGRYVLRERFEVGARLRVASYTFVQTGVNKVTTTRFGPLAIGAAFAIDRQLAIVALAELPYTRDEMETLHAGGTLALAFTSALAGRHVVHARFGVVGAFASSAGGDTQRVALRAGIDLAWRLRARWSLHYGLETEGGWRDGLSTLLVRAGAQWRPRGGSYRIVLGAGAPLFGDEPTTVIVSVGLARDLD